MDLKTLLKERRTIKSSNTKFLNYVESFVSNPTNIDKLKARREKFFLLWEQFNTVQNRIELLDETEMDKNDREEFEETHIDALVLADKILASATPNLSITKSTSPVQLSSITPQVRLPKIELPHFQGSYEEWYNFRDTFNSLIHSNQVLSAIEKFNYLKASLSGEAADILQSLEISEDNYIAAWDMLNERYDNKRVMIKKHIRAIHNLPICTKEGYSSLRTILDGAIKHVRALHSLKRPTDHWDDLLVYIISTKLDIATNKAWECSMDRKSIPTFKDMTDFLAHRCQILDAVAKTQNPPAFLSSKSNQRVSASNVATFDSSCTICNANHSIFQCNKFLQMNQGQRFSAIKNSKLCINCLRSKHPVNKCNSGSCKKCHGRHNTLLHREPNPVEPDSSASRASADSITTNHCGAVQTKEEVLLSTAQVIVYDSKNNAHLCRVILDSGSQSCFVTEELCKRLQIRKTSTTVQITGINQSSSHTTNSANLKIKSRFSNFTSKIQCYILNQITEPLPLKSFNKSSIKIPANIKLADPEFYKSSRIDMLLGAEIFWNLICVGRIQTGKNMPVFQKTHFGWIVSGQLPAIKAKAVVANLTTCNVSTNTKIDTILSAFWQLEEYNPQGVLSPEEKACEAIFTSTYKRNDDGRFIVQLPIKFEVLKCIGDTFQYAQKRFHSLERKLNKNLELKNDYSKFIKEYLELGHMKPSVELEPGQPTFYLPHHGVIKESSSTTKLRVVFDGSAKSTSGFSLNDALMIGPTLQDDLVSILLRFRIHRFVITADIAKMYRQVLIQPTQTPLQRILWRENETSPLKSYDLTTVTYGTASASYLAIRSLQQLAEEEERSYPVGSKIARRDFYVDDLLTGANTLDETSIVINEVNKLLQTGGFVLRKWVSNAPHLISHLQHDMVQRVTLNVDKQENTNILGLQWNPIIDSFQFSIPTFLHTKGITKRNILSNIARLFDPLGLLAPVIIIGKLLMQKIWQLKLDWDESVPMDIFTAWSYFKAQLPELNKLSIPRWISNCSTPTIQLHGFCDASELAYGACIYTRIFDSLTCTTTLICAKSRVAPIKNTSLPRLELCGALLLARLLNKVTRSLNIAISDIYCWTDSTIVLSWITSSSRKWKTFVANRVSEIQDLTKSVEWRHVNSQDNPADMISRGKYPTELIDSQLWWNGPTWLQNNSNEWPVATHNFTHERLPEQRIVSTPVTTDKNAENIHCKFSSFSKMLRVVAYCLRFAHNLRNKSKHMKLMAGPLAVSELNAATACIIHKIQQDNFSRDIDHIIAHGRVHNKSKIISLNPFLDDQNILRVGGRLKNAKIPYNSKYPILLPTGHVTRLIMQYYHVKHLHTGVQNTLAAVRALYWPINGKNAVKDVIRKCVTCFKANPTPAQHIMGHLPLNRINPARPFSNCGVDYFGPLHIRESRRRNSKTLKGYGALFVCMATRAIHLELVSDLSTEAFINALKRFISRRGYPSSIYSDNATNFVGANNELNELHRLFNEENNRNKIITAIHQNRISWHFIPPRSPHFGGIWEAAVKSVKHHLRRVIGNASLTYEEMTTFLIQIEAVLNSRPLTPLSNDPNDLSPLTPAHFLIGDSLTSLCEPELLKISINRLSRWQHLECLKQQFWKQWHREYLATLQQRRKWQSSHTNLQVGQMVLIREDNAPPLQWPLGRIQDVHLGSDNVVRTCTVRTARGSFKRPVTKLCPLPIDSQ